MLILFLAAFIFWLLLGGKEKFLRYISYATGASQ